MTRRTSRPKPEAMQPAPRPATPVREDRLAALQRAVSAFNRERRWKQFHAPKNLAGALAIEAAELLEPMRWMTPRASWDYCRTPEGAAYVRKELADVLLLALSMSDYLGIDLAEAAREKLAQNAERYPAHLARGRADKYTAYQSAAPPRARSSARPKR